MRKNRTGFPNADHSPRTLDQRARADTPRGLAGLARRPRARVLGKQRLVGGGARRGGELLPAACSTTFAPRRPRCTSTSSASAPASSATSSRRRSSAKAAEGVPVRLVVDRHGSDPEGPLACVLRSAHRGGRPGVRRPRDAGPRAPSAPLGTDGARALEPRRARSHRPSQGRRRRRPDRLGRRRRDRGSLQRRPLPRPVPARHRPGRRPAPARLPRQLPLARRSDPGRRRWTRSSRRSRAARSPRGCCTTRPASTGRSPTRSRACSRARRETLDVVNPYVTDRGMIRADRGRRPPRRSRPAVRPREREQLGVRGRAAVPPRGAARRGRSHPRVPGDAARESVRARR